MKTAINKTFASFGVRNFRLYFFGQGVSLCGTWMQTIALSWLVLQLTHSGTKLGFVVAAQFLPVLLFGLWGGVIADRFNKRHILYVTQTLSGLLALTLGLLVVSHSIQLWMVFVLAACLGLVNAIDNPSRQTFVLEMVGRDLLKNAVTLNSTIVNAARIIGPAIAGVLIATAGIGTCFLVNAASYIAVLIALVSMDQGLLRPSPRSISASGQIRAGLKYVWSIPQLKSTLIMMFIIGTFAYEFPVVFPLLATVTLHGNAGTYSAMMAATGIGAVFGGLYTAGRSNTGKYQLVWAAALFGFSILFASFMPSLASVLLVLVVVGALSVLFIALGNTMLQLTSKPQMRGRVMSLWAIAFAGTTPIGGPIIGFISDHFNPRVGLAIGGFSAVVASCIGFFVFTRASRLRVDGT